MQLVFAFSSHADSRIKEEGLTHREVLGIINNPMSVTDAGRRVWYHGYSEDGRVIRVVVAKDRPIIITAHGIRQQV